MTNPGQVPAYYDDIEKPIDFKHYFLLFRKNFSILLTFFIIVVTLGSIYVARMPDQYQATTQLIIERPTGTWAVNQDSSDVSEAKAWTDDYYNTQVQIMTGNTVLRQVVEAQKLTDYYETDNDDYIIQKIQGMIYVSRIKKSRLFNLTIFGDDPRLIARLANAIARAYIRKNFEDRLSSTPEILGLLDKNIKSDMITVEDPLGGMKQLSRQEIIDSLPSIQTDETIRALREKLSFLEADLQSNLRQYREKHPTIVRIRANIKFIKESVEAEKARIIEQLRSKATGEHQVNYARVLEEAQIPKAPTGPNRMKLVMMIALVELFLSLLLIFVIDFFDDTVRSLEDMERKGISLPFLGPIPLVKGGSDPKKTALTAHYDRKSDVSEAFRYLRVAINFSASPEALRQLVLSSCLPHEGKSFVSHNIAISLAQDGNKTLLIDGDLRRPVVHKYFRMDNDTGLSNYLTSNLDFDAILRESFVENLSIVSSGPVSLNPAEILASDRMKEFMKTAHQRFDRVILDCPPLTGLGDGYVIGSMIGHMILVIASGKTPTDLIKRTQEQLDKANIKIMGVVLNQVDMDKERYGGYSKYYYHTYNRYYNREG